MCFTCDMAYSSKSPAIIYQDNQVIVSHSFDMAIPGYLILSLIRHLQHYYELSNKEAQKLAAMSKQAMKVVSTFSNIENIYLLSFGELTKHFHFFLAKPITAKKCCVIKGNYRL